MSSLKPNDFLTFPFIPLNAVSHPWYNIWQAKAECDCGPLREEGTSGLGCWAIDGH